jgi:hypothetical protein
MAQKLVAIGLYQACQIPAKFSPICAPYSTARDDVAS